MTGRTRGAPPRAAADRPPVSAGGEAFSWGRIWWLGVGILGVQLTFALYNAFLPLLYREFIASRALIGLLMGTDNLVGLLLIPVIGAWSDRTETRLGRRLPFVVVGVPLAALSLLAIPYAATALWLLIITEVTFTVAMHSYRGPVATMMLEHTPRPKRSTASGIAQLLGGGGVLISFALLAPLYDRDPRLPFAAGAAVLLLSLVSMVRSAHRRPMFVDAPRVPPSHPVRASIDGLRDLLRADRRPALAVLAAMLTAYTGFAGIQAMFPIYGVETLGLTEGRAASLLTAFAGAFVLAALAAGVLGSRWGTARTMSLGLVALPVLYLGAATISRPGPLLVVLALAGVAWPLFAVPAVAAAADLGGHDRLGFAVGLYYVFTMTGQMIGPFIVGAAMDLFGNRGMWIAAAALTLLALALLRLGVRRGP
jgi:maltose/moltooligosaccharide transporter